MVVVMAKAEEWKAGEEGDGDPEAENGSQDPLVRYLLRRKKNKYNDKLDF